MVLYCKKSKEDDYWITKKFSDLWFKKVRSDKEIKMALKRLPPKQKTSVLHYKDHLIYQVYPSPKILKVIKRNE